jgi:hypothetical protein
MFLAQSISGHTKRFASPDRMDVSFEFEGVRRFSCLTLLALTKLTDNGPATGK